MIPAVLSVISAVYLSTALIVPGAGNFLNCCVVGYLALITASNWWEDSQ